MTRFRLIFAGVFMAVAGVVGARVSLGTAASRLIPGASTRDVAGDEAGLADRAQADPAADAMHFETVDVYVDAGETPLAAYQFSLRSAGKNALLSGLEGGEHAAFRPAPYYDAHALLDEQVIVAAFSTGADLPRGRSRVARLHVAVTGREPARYEAQLQTAAGSDGVRVDAKISVEAVVR
jgi:hypothetical protein